MLQGVRYRYSNAQNLLVSGVAAAQRPIELLRIGDRQGEKPCLVLVILATGEPYPDDDCEAFTSGSGGIALCGASASATGTWTENSTPSCFTVLRLYCIEQ